MARDQGHPLSLVAVERPGKAFLGTFLGTGQGEVKGKREGRWGRGRGESKYLTVGWGQCERRFELVKSFARETTSLN